MPSQLWKQADFWGPTTKPHSQRNLLSAGRRHADHTIMSNQAFQRKQADFWGPTTEPHSQKNLLSAGRRHTDETNMPNQCLQRNPPEFWNPTGDLSSRQKGGLEDRKFVCRFFFCILELQGTLRPATRVCRALQARNPKNIGQKKSPGVPKSQERVSKKSRTGVFWDFFPDFSNFLGAWGRRPRETFFFQVFLLGFGAGGFPNPLPTKENITWLYLKGVFLAAWARASGFSIGGLALANWQMADCAKSSLPWSSRNSREDDRWRGILRNLGELLGIQWGVQQFRISCELLEDLGTIPREYAIWGGLGRFGVSRGSCATHTDSSLLDDDRYSMKLPEGGIRQDVQERWRFQASTWLTRGSTEGYFRKPQTHTGQNQEHC